MNQSYCIKKVKKDLIDKSKKLVYFLENKLIHCPNLPPKLSEIFKIDSIIKIISNIVNKNRI